MTHKLVIDDRGYVRCTFSPDLKLDELGTVRLKRLSHVVPLSLVPYVAFTILRFLFGERGRIAAWTRTWSGPWKVKVIACGEWSVFQYRWEAVRWEIKHMMHCPICLKSL